MSRRLELKNCCPHNFNQLSSEYFPTTLKVYSSQFNGCGAGDVWCTVFQILYLEYCILNTLILYFKYCIEYYIFFQQLWKFIGPSLTGVMQECQFFVSKDFKFSGKNLERPNNIYSSVTLLR